MDVIKQKNEHEQERIDLDFDPFYHEKKFDNVMHFFGVFNNDVFANGNNQPVQKESVVSKFRTGDLIIKDFYR